MKKNLLLLGIALCFTFFLLGRSAEAKYQEFNFSGHPLSEILSKIAKWGKYNIVADLDKGRLEKCIIRTREGELEPEEWFCEEALSILRNAFHFNLNFMRPYVLAYKKGMDGQIAPPFAITKRTQYIPGDQLENVLASLLPGKIKIWLDPATNFASIFGSKDLLDEVKKAIETVDTPVHSLRIEFEVKDLDTNSRVSSFTFVSESQSPFRVLLEPVSPQAFSIDLQGFARVNDDAHTNFDFQMSFQQKQPLESMVIKQRSFAQEKIWQESRVSFANKNISIRWRGMPESYSQRILRQNSTSPDFPEQNFEPPKPSTVTEIDSPSASTYVPNFVSIKVPVQQVFEKLAAIDKMEILCDETVSGTISIFCQAPQTDPEELINLVAAVKGLKVHKTGSRWAIGKPAAIEELIASEREPYVSQELRRLEPKFASERINQVFSFFGCVGSAKPHKIPEKVEVTACDHSLRLAKTLLDNWAEPLRVLNVGVFLHSPFGKCSEKVSVTGFHPFRKIVRNGENSISVQLQQILFNDDGYVSVKSFLDQNEPQKGRIRVQNAFRLPRDPRASLVQVEAFSRIDFKLFCEASGLYKSGTNPEPEKPPQSQNSPSDGAFDSSF